jgi:penicillin-binding protein 1A
MVKYGYLEEEVYDSLKTLEIDVSHYRRLDHNEGLATYFREYLRGELRDWCANHYKADGEAYNLYKDGLKIYTTIDSRMQRYAEEAAREHLGQDLQPKFFEHWENKKRYPKAPFYRLSDKEYDRIITQSIKRSERYRNLKNQGLSEDSIRMNFEVATNMSVFSWDGYKDTLLSPIDSILYYKYFLSVGMMSVEPQTGYVRAYVGGIDYRHFKYDHVMQSRRQVGSTFKPLVYAAAFQELGFGPCTYVPNVPVTFEMPSGQPDWTPKNSDKKREGEMVSLKWGLANSVNYISAYLMKRVKPQKVIELARKMGIESDIDPVPAICLGTPDLKVYEMVGALATFANKGVYNKPIFITRIEDKNGNVIEQFRGEQTDAMSYKTAYRLIELLKGVVETGTGIRLKYKYKLTNPIAGKTGTTDNQSDGWFMGLTPDLVTGVWVGAEDRSVHFRTITYGQGANMALPIWALYMKKVYADKSLDISQGDFEAPENYDFKKDCLEQEENQPPSNSNNSNLEISF